MSLALLEAKKAYEEGEVPVGAIIVRQGEVLASAHNKKESKHDVSSHAEIEALREVGKILGKTDFSDSEIYVTLEPCLMCAGALKAARIKAIHYAAKDKEEGAIEGKYRLFDDNREPHHPLLYRGEREKEAEALLKAFFKERR